MEMKKLVGGRPSIPMHFLLQGNPGTGKGLADQQYGEGPVAFYQLVADWQAAGDLQGLDLE